MYMIQELLQRRKTTVKSIQRLAGLLNFFSKCIIPARTFTRRLYAMTQRFNDKPHYHITLARDVKLDLEMWLTFLQDQTAYSRPFTDFDVNKLTSIDIDMYTDSSANKELGCGGKCGRHWFMQQWEWKFMEQHNPSINYLELYAVTCAILLWTEQYKNRSILIHCDNMSVVNMVNNTTSRCKNCMVLLRVIVLHGLRHNIKIQAKHVPGISNQISDNLSRLKLKQFKSLTTNSNYDQTATPIPLNYGQCQKSG